MDNDLSKLLKNARFKLNLSQRDLSLISGVDYSYIAKIESGNRKKPSLNVLFKFSKSLNISFLLLVKSAGYSKQEINDLIFYSSILISEMLNLDF